MRPVLFAVTNISPLACLGTFLAVLAVVGIWLGVLRWQRRYTRDHLITGLGIAGIFAVFLLLIYHSGQFHVNSYGAMLMLGFVAGITAAMRLSRRRAVPTERILDLGLLILVGAVLGARVVYLLITPGHESFVNLHNLLQQGVGGLSFHGGVLGGLIACLVYVYFTKLNFWRVADCLAPGVAIGYAITRIGCFLNGCCYGKHTDLPWATTFPHSPDGFVANVHPTQIYASLMGFAMFGILLLLSRGKSLVRAGRLLMVFLMLEGIERFVMEIYRQPAPNFHGTLTDAQLLSIVLFIVGIIGWFVLPKRSAVESTITAAPAPQATK